nr:hypothetical protein [Pandoravirus aubagnensis]
MAPFSSRDVAGSERVHVQQKHRVLLLVAGIADGRWRRLVTESKLAIVRRSSATDHVANKKIKSYRDALFLLYAFSHMVRQRRFFSARYARSAGVPVSAQRKKKERAVHRHRPNSHRRKKGPKQKKRKESPRTGLRLRVPLSATVHRSFSPPPHPDLSKNFLLVIRPRTHPRGWTVQRRTCVP